MRIEPRALVIEPGILPSTTELYILVPEQETLVHSYQTAFLMYKWFFFLIPSYKNNHLGWRIASEGNI